MLSEELYASRVLNNVTLVWNAIGAILPDQTLTTSVGDWDFSISARHGFWMTRFDVERPVKFTEVIYDSQPYFINFQQALRLLEDYISWDDFNLACIRLIDRARDELDNKALDLRKQKAYLSDCDYYLDMLALNLNSSLHEFDIELPSF